MESVAEESNSEEENPLYPEERSEVTTDGSEEYFSHDNESVDRLMYDGESRLSMPNRQ